MKLLSLVAVLLCLLFCNPSNAHDLKVMVFAPHPDDELVGCGGSIAKHVKLGNNVHVVYMTSGDAGNMKYKKEELASIREAEALRGLNIIGVKNSHFLRSKDGYLEVSPAELIKVVELIRIYKPDIVYLPHADEAHQDHKVTNDLVLKAINKARGNWFQEAKGEPWTVKTIFAYEVYPLQKTVNYCEDVTEFMDLKYKALKEHKTQIESVAYDDLAESISRYRGILNSGSKYGECFQVIKISDLFE
jgi:LmbE family N-acetylglucosaminyl deacetylase